MDVLLVLLVVLYASVKAELIGYWFHRLIHLKWTGPLYRRHMEHHLELYPGKSFFSDKYLNTKGLSTVWLFAPMFFFFIVLHWFLLPLYLFIPYLTAISVAAFANDYFHQTFHVRNNWLTRWKWFRRIRARHYQHHVFMGKNFGIYYFGPDRLFGTYYKKR